ncbi:MAG TPA: AAA family ATPase, partial [Solirubrobacteraceae bacterium]|nr:AAA family ATPase [Solirubrobacteraceae bacterium]
MPTFGEIVERSLALLERRRRVSHTALRLEFALDDTTFAALRDELVDVLGAADDDGRVLAARNGHAPTQEQSPPAPAPRALPAEAAEPVEPAEPAGSSRELVTVLLCDLAETPALAALDAEARSVVTTRFATVCGEVAGRRRGHVQPWISDGVAIFFGHHGAQDDDALRAVRCGWEILRALDTARAGIERDFGLSVCARLAVATGPAAGAADTFGDTPRLAGRVQAGGAPDSVTVDGATQERASAHFAFEPVTGGLFELSGQLAGGVGTRRAPTPLVGRASERSLLRALAERAAAGSRAAVLIRGEAGIGKTRLVDELAARACDDLGVTLLHCISSPYHRGSPLHPLLAGLRRHWQLDGPQASARLAEHALGLPGGDRAVALLAAQLGVALPDRIAPLPEMSPRRRRRETLAVLAAALTAEARHAPLLVVVEDLHWADPTTLELIGTLLDGPREVALMLALTARSEYMPPPSTSMQRIELGRLDADDSRRLAEAVAAEDALPDGLAAELAQRAGGSPLLVEELTRTVLATQDPAAAGAATLYGCLMARLDRDTPARSVAQLAATIGRGFDVALLEAVGGIERSALDWGLERLVQEDLVAPVGAGSYAFRHTLLQEAARSSLGKEVLREHNLRIARALKESFPHVAAAEPERVARHLEYGGSLPPSVRRWRQAGLQALHQHALREATGHFQRALDLTARTPDGDERRSAELSLRVLAGLAIAMQDGWDSPPAVAHYARAEQLSHHVTGAPMLVRCMLGLTTHQIVAGRLEEALALAREQVKVAERARDRELVLEAECEAGAALLYLGRHRDALPRFARSIELYDPAGHREHVRRYGRN